MTAWTPGVDTVSRVRSPSHPPESYRFEAGVTVPACLAPLLLSLEGYTTMTRATVANRLYVIADRNHARTEFAPAEPARDGRVLLAAALTRRRAEELALDQLLPSRDRDRGIER
jgi:hypothetical protein